MKYKKAVHRNENGAFFEREVLTAIEQRFGLPVIKYSDYMAIDPQSRPSKCVLTNAPYEGYKKKLGWNLPTEEFPTKRGTRPSRTEYVVIIDGNTHIRLECKFQDTSGSVIDKLPATVIDLQNYIPEKESFIVVGGQVLTNNIGYVRNLCSQNFLTTTDGPKKIINVGSLNELIQYLHFKLA